MSRKSSKLPFVNLHAHDGYSVFDAFGDPEEHLDAAWENGLDAHAITNHGHMNSLPNLVLHAQKMNKDGKDFKLIMGCEAYFHPDIEEWQNLREFEATAKKVKGNDAFDEIDMSSDASVKRSSRHKESVNHRRHLTIFAKNQAGLSNLCQLITQSHRAPNFYRYPRIDFNNLKQHHEGLIVTTGCLIGLMAGEYWSHREEGLSAVYENMQQTAERMIGIFGKENFIGEIQWNGLPEQHDLNHLVIRLAKEYGLRLISTADCHYPRKQDWQFREIYRRLGWLSYGDDPFGDMPTSTDEIGFELYPKNGDEIWESFLKYREASDLPYDAELVHQSIINAADIAENNIEKFSPDNTVRLPSFVVPEGVTAEEELRDLAFEGLRAKKTIIKRWGGDWGEYLERLNIELDVINAKGFAEYFLTMMQAVDEAKSIMLCGTARGSAAGALLSYAIGITQIDPIRFDLQFERFMRKDDPGYPDIDFDVADRIHLTDHLIAKWGEDKVVPITNWNTMKLKSLIKDLGKYFGLEFQTINTLTKSFYLAEEKIKVERGQSAGVLHPPATHDEMLRNSPEYLQFCIDHPEIEQFIEKLNGCLRSKGRHAGGVVIAEDIPKFMPLIRGAALKQEDKERRRAMGLPDYILQTPWSEGLRDRHLEPMGFIKFDFLGLKTLDMMRECIELILKRHHGISNPTHKDVQRFYDQHLHPDVHDFDEKAVWVNVFHDGNFAGVFQMSNNGAQSFCTEVKPDDVVEFAVVTSIYRPGPISAGVHTQYPKAKKGGKKPYEHPILQEVLGETYGFLIFQEQLATLVHRLGDGIDVEAGNLIRKKLTKFKDPNHPEVVKYRDNFVQGSIAKGLKRTFAEALWKKVCQMSTYSFNKSHAISYACISYQCAWLLTHYKKEWLSGYLQVETEKTDVNKNAAISVVRSLGVDISLPNANHSSNAWIPSNDDQDLLYQPLTAIKGVAQNAYEELVKHRPYSRLEELLFDDAVDRRKLNKRVIKALLLCGALDNLWEDDERFTSLHHMIEVINNMKVGWKKLTVRIEPKWEQLIEDLASTKPFTINERVQQIRELTGIIPVHLLISPGTLQRLRKSGISSLSKNHPDPMDPNVAWGIMVDAEVMRRNNKKRLKMKFVDDTGSETDVMCWNYVPKRDNVHINAPMLLRLRYDTQWGYSISNLSKDMKRI
jgi:DNA polymerase-3 subunit alpha